MAEISHAEKLECAERELKLRRRAYPRWIAGGRLAQAKADREIATMAAIVEDYRKLTAGERLI